MFTGIIEATGTIIDIQVNGSNKTFWIESSLSPEFKIDQSISHSGVCLTIEEIKDKMHRVTAIDETLLKTNLNDWKKGDLVNLERCLALNGRLDGHFVQGHVDTKGTCIQKTDKEGSFEYDIVFPTSFAPLVIEKGSISLNGISLTVFNVTHERLTVAIIPYTFHHTNISQLSPGDTVNLEFDLIGKYLARRAELSK